jgi:hypothetical protein
MHPLSARIAVVLLVDTSLQPVLLLLYRDITYPRIGILSIVSITQ